MKPTKKPPVYTMHRVRKGWLAAGVCAGMVCASLSGAAGGYAYATLHGNQDESTATPAQSVMASPETDLSAVVESCRQSVVEITTETREDNPVFSGYAIEQGAGSGVIVSEDGYIITNHHVISGASSIAVKTTAGQTYEASVVGSDEVSDVAVLKVDAQGLPAARIGTSSNLQVGQTTIAIGNPLGSLGGTVTTGILSALDREIEVDGEPMTLLQTDAAVNPGNSGGGLFDASGSLIGIVNAKTSSEGIEGLGFAIPVDEAMAVAQQLMNDGAVTNRAAMHVSLVDDSRQGAAGVYIAQIVENGAADQAGLRVMDRIVSIDKEAVDSAADVKKIVRSHQAGDTLTMEIERDGSRQTVELVLGSSQN